MSSNMECQCACRPAEGKEINFWSKKMVVARKEHTCDECDETIPIGQRYLFGKGLCDGCWFEYHCCEPCKRIAESFCYRGLGGLRDELRFLLEFDYVTGEYDEEQRRMFVS